MAAVSFLDVEYGMPFVEGVLPLSKEGEAIHKVLEEHGLMPMHERARVFSMYSPGSAKAIAIGIIPFVSRDLNMAGGLSLSQGGHAKAVIVQMAERTRLVEFRTLDFVDGEVKIERFDTSQLAKMGVKALADQAGVIRSEKPLVDLSVRQVRSITDMGYNSLLADESSRTVHPAEEIEALRANARIVSDIGTFVLLRSVGSPGGCSCSSSCWGCSSCSCSWS